MGLVETELLLVLQGAHGGHGPEVVVEGGGTPRLASGRFWSFSVHRYAKLTFDSLYVLMMSLTHGNDYPDIRRIGQ